LEQVKDFVDVVALFTEVTKFYTYKFPSYVSVIDEDYEKMISLELDYESE